MIVADTGAIVALVDADDRHHGSVREVYDQDPAAWVLPWAILPEVDYLLGTHVGPRAQDAFFADVAAGAFQIERGADGDLARALELHTRHRALRLGLVDAVVMAVAERLRADAIATLDVRHFGAIRLRGRPKLLPRDRD
jgi:predicted nucleic acid-binding protein